ncbi:hypothetical protein HYS97_00720 [Candidatus Daviesbacteria bacterium]|nr:hypothetical protein [Candidatus Daviesbacteria bacterium]
MSKNIHFMGIGGSGASAAAAIAKAYGFTVTGCDTNSSDEFSKQLEGIEIQKGHSKTHLQNVDMLIISPAVSSLNSDHAELEEARRKKIKILTWQEFLGRKLLKNKFIIAICGTHGKSTTTAMIGQILEDAGFDPTVVLGAIVKKWGRNYRVGLSKYAVIEADEFNENFMALDPTISVVTAIEFDHPEYFKDFESYKRSFQNFLGKTKQVIIANLSDNGLSETLEDERALFGSFFKPIIDYSKALIDFTLGIPGSFNRSNASAAYHVAVTLGINPKIARESLQNFREIGRRLEGLGEVNGAKIYSDFSHHPTEIKLRIEAVREKFPDKKIMLIYQPHMFSRTKALFENFVKVFRDLQVDKVIITDIYPSREVDTGLVNSRQLVEAIKQNNVQYISKQQLESQLITHPSFGGNQVTDQLVIFMGAGDIDNLAREFANG